MANIERIIKAIDKFIENKNQNFTTPVEINKYLEKIGLLNDSKSRPGLPIRKILRDGKIKHAYQIGSNWIIPHSGNSIKEQNSAHTEKVITKIDVPRIFVKEHKLSSIGKLVIELIEKKYKKTPKCYFEYKPKWLMSYPTVDIIEKCTELNELYAELVENRFTLSEKLDELTETKINQKQSFDIWIGEPFNFAIEFDERQHFNQYRKITLNYYKNKKIKFPLDFYTKLNKDISVRPGISGFTCLKSIDPLFPKMLEGEKQDNRIRQRAFRDFLKDLLPIENNCNPTMCIPFQLTNNRITNFTESDLKNVEKYIIENNLL